MGGGLETSTPCGWVGAIAVALKPLVDALAADLLGGDTLRLPGRRLSAALFSRQGKQCIDD